MLKIIKEVDKEVNDLSTDELLGLDWNSVPKYEFLIIRDDKLLHCPTEIITMHYDSDHYSETVNMYVLTKTINNCKSYINWYPLYKLIDNFFSTTFLKNNIKYIVHQLSSHTIRINSQQKLSRFIGFDDVYDKLIQRNLVSFFDVDISFDQICSTWSAYDALVPHEDWCKLIDETNFLYYVISECDLEDNPLPVKVDVLHRNGIGINPMVDTRWVINNDYGVEDYDSVDYLKSLPSTYNCWDFFIDEFYSGRINSDIINTVWNTHILTSKPVLRLDSSEYLKPNKGLSKTNTIGY